METVVTYEALQTPPPDKAEKIDETEHGSVQIDSLIDKKHTREYQYHCKKKQKTDTPGGSVEKEYKEKTTPGR